MTNRAPSGHFWSIVSKKRQFYKLQRWLCSPWHYHWYYQIFIKQKQKWNGTWFLMLWIKEKKSFISKNSGLKRHQTRDASSSLCCTKKNFFFFSEELCLSKWLFYWTKRMWWYWIQVWFSDLPQYAEWILDKATKTFNKTFTGWEGMLQSFRISILFS